MFIACGPVAWFAASRQALPHYDGIMGGAARLRTQTHTQIYIHSAKNPTALWIVACSWLWPGERDLDIIIIIRNRAVRLLLLLLLWIRWFGGGETRRR